MIDFVNLIGFVVVYGLALYGANSLINDLARRGTSAARPFSEPPIRDGGGDPAET